MQRWLREEAEKAGSALEKAEDGVEEDAAEVVGIARAGDVDKALSFVKAVVEATVRGGTYEAIHLGDEAAETFEVERGSDLDALEGPPSILSLRQMGEVSSGSIYLMREGGIVCVVARYIGPRIDPEEFFSFSVEVGSFGLPKFFGAGGELTPLALIEATEGGAPGSRSGREGSAVGSGTGGEEEKNPLEGDLEAETFERVTGKHAWYQGRVTTTFKRWRGRRAREYRRRADGVAYYRKGEIHHQPTKGYAEFLRNLASGGD
jgi:hypothetical protein